jgi:nucleoside-diphosphate-sugar epimerase
LSTFLVTGGAGFIGSHLSRNLAQSGHTVLVLDNLTGKGAVERAEEMAEQGISLMRGDVQDAAVCESACRGVDFVLHLAAEPSVARSIEDPSTCVAVNVEGTVNMLQGAARSGSVRRFVYTSTCAVYGDASSGAIQETNPLDPLTPYASSKLAGEYFCRNFFRLHGLETVALRYFNVYGAGQDPNGAYAAVIPRFLSRIVAGEPIVVYGDGEQSRDFVHIDDVVAANILAATADRSVCGRSFNIGSGRRTSLNELIDKLEKIAGTRVAVERQPARNGDIKHSHADIGAAARSLGYAPSVPLGEGLLRTMEFFRVISSLDCIQTTSMR